LLGSFSASPDWEKTHGSTELVDRRLAGLLSDTKNSHRCSILCSNLCKPPNHRAALLLQHLPFILSLPGLFAMDIKFLVALIPWLAELLLLCNRSLDKNEK